MSLHTSLPVYRDTYNLILKIFELTKDFPKEYKYTIGQDLKKDSLHLIRSIYRANKHKSLQRVEHLDNFLDQFELIKLEIRLCVDLKILSVKKHVLLTEILDKIGKQVIGWRKSTQ